MFNLLQVQAQLATLKCMLVQNIVLNQGMLLLLSGVRGQRQPVTVLLALASGAGQLSSIPASGAMKRKIC